MSEQLKSNPAEEIFRGLNVPAERVADMAHELRSPLGGIESMLALLAETHARSDQEALIAGLRAAAAHLRNVATALLKPETPAEVAPVSDALKFFGVSARSRAHAAGRGFIAEVDLNCAHYLVGNGTAFRQMLENLADNALRHGEGDLVLTAGVCGEQPQVVVSMNDSGASLTDEMRARMFQRHASGGDGAGLGLAIVAQLAATHGGACGVKAREDGMAGLCVWFSLPVTLRPDERASLKDERVMSAPLLVVDDDPMSQLLMKTVLGHLGHEVETVASAAEAMAVMQDRVFSAIFTDMTMPGMSGWDFIAWLRGEGVEIPIVGVSGRVLPEDKARAKEAGANWMIDKPTTIHDIRQALVAIGLRDPMMRQVSAA